MPTFTTIAFDRLIEPGVSTARNSPDPKLERRHSTPNPTSKINRGGVDIHVPPKLGNRKNQASAKVSSGADKNHHWTQISPALYATPESTPLPDSPSSFPPSPYIINHKRRSQQLVKCLSEDDVVSWEHDAGEMWADDNGNSDRVKAESVPKEDGFLPIKVPHFGMEWSDKEKHLNASFNYGNLCQDVESGQEWINVMVKSFSELGLCLEGSEADDFFDPQESMSLKSTIESEGNGGAEQPSNSTPLAEFYDAWEEFSENDPQIQMLDLETELHETRLSLLMEREKREQAEEALCNTQNQWHKIFETLSLVGLTLPFHPTTLPENEQQSVDHADELCRQVCLASNSIRRGIAEAEVEIEMEAMIKMKNSEIARLLDRLRYYEAMNLEMSHRNQEVVESTRRVRRRRERIQKWVWASIAAAVTFGSAILAYSYFHTEKTSSSESPSRVHTINRDTS